MRRRPARLRIGLSGLLLLSALAGCGRYGKPERYRPTPPPAPAPDSRLQTHAAGAEKRYTLVDRGPLARVSGVPPATGC